MNVINNTDIQNIYLTIPIEYVIIYNEILKRILEKGLNILKDCKAICNCNETKLIFDCWYAFQSAIAAKKLGKEKEAEVIINYISAQLEISTDCICNINTIDENENLLAEVNCDYCNFPIFEVNPLTGDLIIKDGNVEDFNIVDNNLIQTYE